MPLTLVVMIIFVEQQSMFSIIKLALLTQGNCACCVKVPSVLQMISDYSDIRRNPTDYLLSRPCRINRLFWLIILFPACSASQIKELTGLETLTCNQLIFGEIAYRRIIPQIKELIHVPIIEIAKYQCLAQYALDVTQFVKITSRMPKKCQHNPTPQPMLND